MDHTPVLLQEVLSLFAPKSGARLLDCTVGLGGHAAALLASAGEGSSLVALDTDASNLERAKKNLPAYLSTFIHDNFASLPDCLPSDRRSFDIILADLGVSSVHFDDASRGFSFRHDAPLDMRLDQTKWMPASSLLSSLDRTTLIRIFHDYGELERSHKLVDEIIRRRTEEPVRTTTDLTAAVLTAYGPKGRDCFPQVFQALRIAVNDELRSLEHLLKTAPALLAPGGIFGVISFHSLEDRMVKCAFRDASTAEKDPITGQELSAPAFELLTKRAVQPTEDEIASNSRSRSARFRAIRRRLSYTSDRS